MGREHLTPQVVDWNNDGKPDVISGERVGYIDVYLNQANTKEDQPVFDQDHPMHIQFGSAEKVGGFPTVCVADINHDKLFDLVLGSADGKILYALNTGRLGNPQFGAPTPFKGTSPHQEIIEPFNWAIDRYRPDGAPFGYLRCTNSTVEPGFSLPPEPFKGRGALEYSIFPANNLVFPEVYHPDDETVALKYHSSVQLFAEKTYTLALWIKTEGKISDMEWFLEGDQGVSVETTTHHTYFGPISTGGGTWSRLEVKIRIPRTVEVATAGKLENGNFDFGFHFHGNGKLYLDDISLKQSR